MQYSDVTIPPYHYQFSIGPKTLNQFEIDLDTRLKFANFNQFYPQTINQNDNWSVEGKIKNCSERGFQKRRRKAGNFMICSLKV